MDCRLFSLYATSPPVEMITGRSVVVILSIRIKWLISVLAILRMEMLSPSRHEPGFKFLWGH